MFNNLTAELARYGINAKTLSLKIGTCEKSVNNKMAGRTEFTLKEIKKIAAMFPDKTVDYLFEISTEKKEHDHQ